MITGFAVAALIVVVVGTVFLGSRLWHGLFGAGDDYAGRRGQRRRHRGPQRRLHDDDRQDAARPQGGGDGEDVRRRRRGQRRDLGDPARVLQGAHRDTGDGCRCATRRFAEPGGAAGDPGGASTRRHHRRQDQRRHRGHLHPDLRGDVRAASTARKQCVKADDLKQAAGSADPSALSIPDLGARSDQGASATTTAASRA